MGAIVFSDASKMRQLESIVWPHIASAIHQRIAEYKERGDVKVVVLEAAVMLEAGWDKLVDEIWAVEVEPEVSIERLMRRNGFTSEESQKRMAMQRTNEERRKAAGVVIRNEGDEAQLREKVEQIVRERGLFA